MITVILTIHVLIVLALIGVVLLQRSEGGALGMGGGGGGFMTGRGAANALTRTTSVLAALFFATSLALAVLAGRGETEESVLKELTGAPAQETAPAESQAPGAVGVEDLLKTLGAESPAQPEAGESAAPPMQEAAPETPAPAETGEEAPPEEAAPEQNPQ